MIRELLVQKAFRVQPSLWAEAKATADRRGDNLSQKIREFLRGYVRRNR